MPSEDFAYVPWQNQDGKGQDLCAAAQKVTIPVAVINTVATIGEWRSWYLQSDAEGHAIRVESGRSAGWDDEWWNEQMRIKNREKADAQH